MSTKSKEDKLEQRKKKPPMKKKKRRMHGESDEEVSMEKEVSDVSEEE